MNDKLKTLLHMAVKQSGTYDPEEALTYVEEQLTGEEFDLASEFLLWVHRNERTFGHGNFEDVFQEYKESA